MTLDADYVCDTTVDIYNAAEDIQMLLNQTYNIGTNIEQVYSTVFGTGYEVKGNIKINLFKHFLNRI